MNIQVESESKLSLVFDGQTYPFKSNLDALGLSGGYHKEDGDTDDKKGDFYRYLRNIDLDDENEDGEKRIKSILGLGGFNNIAMRVIVDTVPEEDSSVSTFIEELKEMPTMHFK